MIHCITYIYIYIYAYCIYIYIYIYAHTNICVYIYIYIYMQEGLRAGGDPLVADGEVYLGATQRDPSPQQSSLLSLNWMYHT